MSRAIDNAPPPAHPMTSNDSYRSRKQTVREYYEEGDRAWITIDYQGVLAMDLGPTHKTGDTLRLTGRSAFTFRDGAIIELVDES